MCHLDTKGPKIHAKYKRRQRPNNYQWLMDSLLVKEENEKVGLKLNIQKTKTMASGPITSWQVDGETVETVADYFSGLQNHCRW